jgi:hypothetical protein
MQQPQGKQGRRQNLEGTNYLASLFFSSNEDDTYILKESAYTKYNNNKKVNMVANTCTPNYLGG